MQKILIVGATSAIAEATARRYAARGAQLFLTARNAGRLKAIALDLSTRGAASVEGFVLDINDFDRHDAFLDAAWANLGHVDVALIAHGTLPSQAECDASREIALCEFATNGTSAIALSHTLAQRLTRGAVLAVISSVAGDRGRASNYLYGSAKAAVSTYLSGLGGRLRREGVHVLVVKPGFVDTPMTRELAKGVLWARPDKVAAGIVRAIDRRRPVAYLPAFWWPIMQVIKFIPESLFRKLPL